MKARFFISALALFLSAALYMSCNKNDNNDNNNTPEDRFKVSGAASGAQERPNPVTTAATGTISGTYHTEDHMLDYTITWSGLSADPTAMHFHGPAGVDSAAGVQVPITGFTVASSGSVSGMAMLTTDQETQLLDGKWYYNIHTSTNPGGEIRGQVILAHD